MRQAFADEGYEVIEITGSARDRVRALRTLSRRLEGGLRVEFGYGENSTMPTVLTEPHHVPTHPLVDLNVLRLLRRYGIPTGMFYRDIYWRFDEYTDRVNPVIAAGTRTLYHAELVAYRRLLDRVYLPSLRIAAYVPHLRSEQGKALPPGGRIVDASEGDGRPPNRANVLNVLYVGNISPYYRMHELLRAIGESEGLTLTLCVPEDAWTNNRSDYASVMSDRVQVVHHRGEELNALFARADVCSLMVEPSEYRDFAAPIKLYEYLGHGKPVLASAGTLAAHSAQDGDFGWAVPYDSAAIAGRLSQLRDDPDALALATGSARATRHHHTWNARARTVATDLADFDRRPHR